MKRFCPSCGCDMMRVIYSAIPAWLCSDEECSRLDGIFADLIVLLTKIDPSDDFMFLSYEGSYWHALKHWFQETSRK